MYGIVFHTFPIMIFPAFQDLSLGILAGGDRRTMTADTTFTTAAGGFPNDFNSVRLAYREEREGKLPNYGRFKVVAGDIPI